MNEVVKKIGKAFYFFPGKVYNGTRLRLHRFSVGKGFRSTGRIWIINHSRQKSTIGDYVQIRSSERSNPIGCGNKTILRVLRTGKIAIGNHVSMSNVAITSASEVKIEDYAMIGSGARIYDTDFHSLNPDIRLQLSGKREPAKTRPVTIGKMSFVGTGVIVLKGTTIGEGAVIGAGSVVSGTVPPWQVWAGNPAQYIRDLTPEERQLYIESE